MSDYRDLPVTTRAPLPPPLEAQLQRELQPGERVVWVGRPTLRSALRGGSPVLVFLAMWYGFFGVNAWALSSSGSSACLAPFFLAGLMPLGSIVGGVWNAHRCFYAVTDRRAIVSRTLRHRKTELRSFTPDAIAPLRLVERAESGDVVLSVDRDVDDGVTVERPVGFLGIADARAAHAHVVNLVREAQAEREPNLPEPAELAEPEAEQRRQRR